MGVSLTIWVVTRLFRPRGDWIRVRISSRLTEFSRLQPFLRRLVLRELKQERATSLEALRALVRYARVDRGMRGVVVEMPPLHAGCGHCASLRDVLLEARRCAKEVVVFLSEGATNREMFVASAADRVFVAPRSTVSLTGLSVESRYVQPLLERLGLRVEVLALGQYKTAAEPFVRSTMSDAQPLVFFRLYSSR